MSEELHERLRRYRAERLGRELRPRLAASLGETLGQPILLEDFLDLDRTRHIRDRFYGVLLGDLPDPGIHRGEWHMSQAQEIWAAVAEVATRVGELRALLLHQEDEYTGALRVPARPVLAHVGEVWRVEEDDLCLCTEDAADGFLLEFNYLGGRTSEWERDLVELTTWGAFAPVR
jgi:hypothetical protein